MAIFIAFLEPRPLPSSNRYFRQRIAHLGIHVHGGSSQALTGEIDLSEIQNVFAEVSICPETMNLLQKSLRETHFEATTTCFEYSMESQGFLRGTPRKPVRDGRTALGTLRNRVWVPESIFSKDVHESTWRAFLSARWTL